ncbi:hypothetical protein F7Q99_16185 [Streptomyces kaniharaensis]|uniref:Acyl-CoA dehydrogenase n=1 Tax=Streptomyces kaniharaensis TaxID=212423 RepID=A0A6N7KSH8_9ACTN|nr:hypothetical protein [Streptomyces kaniharaensis]MQS13765.1 hypothetical protein [Streptomyces kaniharaensis]
MHDVQPLVEAADKLADRFRSLPQSKLLGAVPGYDSRAAAALALARRLAALALAVEGGPEREFPDAGAFAVGDQLAVAGHDLAAALEGLPEGAEVALPEALGGPADASAVLAGAVAAVGETAALCA